jgi:hypothetical protein
MSITFLLRYHKQLKLLCGLGLGTAKSLVDKGFEFGKRMICTQVVAIIS